MTYEEFRKDWYSKLSELELGYPYRGPMPGILEYFCECDYKRYTGEWDKDEL